MSKGKALIAAALTVSVAAATMVMVQAQQKSKAPTLTPLDYVEIQQLVARYPYALNSGANNGYVMADLFTPDAIFCGRAVLYSQGRDQLAALARGRRSGPAYTVHFSTNHVIDPSPEGATGKLYLVVLDIGEDGKPSSINQGGHYDDVYVKTPNGWRFKLRNYMPSNWVPPQPCAPRPQR